MTADEEAGIVAVDTPSVSPDGTVFTTAQVKQTYGALVLSGAVDDEDSLGAIGADKNIGSPTERTLGGVVLTGAANDSGIAEWFEASDAMVFAIDPALKPDLTYLSSVVLDSGRATTENGKDIWYVTDDQPATPDVEVIYLGSKLTPGEDYVVEYKNNTETGIATAVIKPGSNGLFTGEYSCDFEVRKVAQDVSFAFSVVETPDTSVEVAEGEEAPVVKTATLTGVDFTGDRNEVLELPAVTPEGAVDLEGNPVEAGLPVTQLALPESGQWAGHQKAYSLSIPSSVEVVEPGLLNTTSSVKHLSIDAQAVGAEAFSGCIGIESVSFGPHVKQLGGRAFYGCTGLSSLDFSEDGETLEFEYWNRYSAGYQFYGCSSLESVVLSPRIKPTGGRAFASCSNLKEATAWTVGSYDFANLSSLEVVHLMGGTVGQYAFNSAGLKKIDFATDAPITVSGYAFRYCSNLSSLEIPSNVTLSGAYTFDSCTGLREVTYLEGCTTTGSGSNMFKSCTGLTSLSLPSTMKTIGTYAFYLDASLGNVTFPEGLEKIDSSAFNGCTAITEVILPDSITSLGGNAFYGTTKLTTMRLPQGIATLPSGLFGKSGLVHVDIPEGVTTLKGALAYCPSLESVTLPSSLTTMDGAFKECVELKEIVIPEGVNHLGWDCFSGCSHLETVDIRSTSFQVGSAPFTQCDALQEVKLAEGLTTVPANLFAKSGVRQVQVPSTVTSIGQYAFQNCANLSSINFPNGLATLGTYAFQNCTSLTAVSFPTALTAIPNYAFDGCTSLAQATGMDEVTSVGQYAFQKTALTQVALPKVKTISGYAFNGCGQLTTATYPAEATVATTAFNGCPLESAVEPGLLVIEEGTTEIPASAYSGRTDFTEVYVPDGVEVIGKSAFYGCSEMRKISLPASLKSIDQSAFNSASALVEVEFREAPEGQEAPGLTIGDRVFCNNSLKELVLPNNVIACGTLSQQPQLERIVYSQAMTAIPQATNFTKLKEVVLPEKITAIPSSAFKGDLALESIVIPDGVVSVGYSAFQDCAALKDVRLPSSLLEISDYAFRGCSSLIRVEMPDSLLQVDSWAFADCTSLTQIAFPKKGISIGPSVFKNCTALKEVSIPGTVYHCPNTNSYDLKYVLVAANTPITEAMGIPQEYGVEVGDSLPVSIQFGTTPGLGTSMFEGCTSLQSVTLGEGLKVIGENAFYGCTSLEEIVIPEGLEQICGAAFYQTGLKEIDAPASVHTLGHVDNSQRGSVFYGCEQLERASFPGLKTMLPSTFVDCASLKEVYLGEGLELLYNAQFVRCEELTSLILPGNYEYKVHGNSSTTGAVAYECPNLKRVVVGAAAKQILRLNQDVEEVVVTGSAPVGDQAFDRCTGLERLTFLGDVPSVGKQAFNGCTGLTSLPLPNTVQTIGEQAFANCANLTTAELPAALTTIGTSAFQGCTKLVAVTIPAALEELPSQLFSGCTSLDTLTFLSQDPAKPSLSAADAVTFSGVGADAPVYVRGYASADTVRQLASLHSTSKPGPLGGKSFVFQFIDQDSFALRADAQATAAVASYGYQKGDLALRATALSTSSAGQLAGFGDSSFQWFRLRVTTDGSLVPERIQGATASTYEVPVGLDSGDYYYYCVVSAVDSYGASVRASTNAVTVTVQPLTTAVAWPADAVEDVTSESVTLAPAVVTPEGQEVGELQYALSTANTMPEDDAWQVSRSFAGLEANTAYYAFARVTGSQNYAWAITPQPVEFKTLGITLPEAGLPEGVVYDPRATLADYPLANGWAWADETVVPTVDDGSYEALYAIPEELRGGDFTNYGEAFDPENFTISRRFGFAVAKAQPTVVAAPAAGTLTYGDVLGSAALNGGSATVVSSKGTSVVDGSFLWDEADSVPAAGTAGRAVIFQPADAVNYAPAVCTASVTVNPLAVSAVNGTVALSSSAIAYTGAAIQPITGITIDGLQVDPSCYSISYNNNLLPGTASYLVTFHGNYSGTLGGTFAITGTVPGTSAGTGDSGSAVGGNGGQGSVANNTTNNTTNNNTTTNNNYTTTNSTNTSSTTNPVNGSSMAGGTGATAAAPQGLFNGGSVAGTAAGAGAQSAEAADALGLGLADGQDPLAGVDSAVGANVAGVAGEAAASVGNSADPTADVIADSDVPLAGTGGSAQDGFQLETWMLLLLVAGAIMLAGGALYLRQRKQMSYDVDGEDQQEAA